MLKSGDEILKKIDQTLDQLIENASVMQQIASNPPFKREYEALDNMQESLLAHLMHLYEFLEKENGGTKRQKVRVSEKMEIFRSLKAQPAFKIRRRSSKKNLIVR